MHVYGFAFLLQHREQVKTELQGVMEELQPLQLKWEHQKGRLDEIRVLKEKLERLRVKVLSARRSGDINAAADIEFGAIPDVQQRLEQVTKLQAEERQREAMLARERDSLTSYCDDEEDARAGERSEGKLGADAPSSSAAEKPRVTSPAMGGIMLSEHVGAHEVAEVVSRWTGVPVNKLTLTQRQRLLGLADRMATQVVGQETAVQSVADAVMRTRAGLARQNQPTGSFLFVGPTGVGKTQLAKALAMELYDSEKNIVRIDMSEYGKLTH